MKSICFFSSYFNQDTIPYYVKYYLEELKKHFSEVVFLTNKKRLSDNEISYLKNLNIDLMLFDNEGYDFGMWYKAMKEFDFSTYERVGLINDSAILFKSLAKTFEQINSSNWDYCGLVASKRISFHIQSYFVIINKNAINLVRDYFMNNGIVNDYKQVIKTYEVGLSAYLQEKKLNVGALYFSKKNIEQHNPSFLIIEELIQEGLPLIKKKIIFRSYRKGEYLSLLRMKFNINQLYYIKYIENSNENEKLINFDLVLNDFPNKNIFDIYIYRIILFFYKIASKSKILRYVFHQLIFFRRKLRGDKNKDIIVTSDSKIF